MGIYQHGNSNQSLYPPNITDGSSNSTTVVEGLLFPTDRDVSYPVGTEWAWDDRLWKLVGFYFESREIRAKWVEYIFNDPNIR